MSSENSRLPNSHYTRSMSYYLNTLSAFSKQKVRIISSGSPTAGPGGLIEFTLPRGLVDLSTMTMSFVGTPSNGAFPRDIETLIDNYSVEAPGGLIQTFNNSYARIFNIIADTSLPPNLNNRRSILQNGGTQATPTAAPAAQTFAIKSWLGFLGSVQPHIVPTNLIGDTRVRIGLSGANIMLAVAGQSPTFSLDKIQISVDVIKIADGVYEEMLLHHVSSGNVLELPFSGYQSWSQYNSTSWDVTQKFGFATQSLDQLWACHYLSSEQAAGPALNGTSQYFHRPAGKYVKDQVFSLNGTQFPSVPMAPLLSFGLLEDSLGVSQDTLHSVRDNITSPATWLDQAVFCTSFQHVDDDSSRLVSGWNTTGAQSNFLYISTGNGAKPADIIVTPATGSTSAVTAPDTNTSFVFAKYTSKLCIGAGGQLYVTQ